MTVDVALVGTPSRCFDLVDVGSVHPQEFGWQFADSPYEDRFSFGWFSDWAWC
jgi:hypothetical protein